jgi:hypothetical protein
VAPVDRTNTYQEIIEHLFFKGFSDGAVEVPFQRFEIPEAASDLGLKIPANLGDVVYSLRYRTPLPDSVAKKAPDGQEWAIFPAGRSVYCFRPVAFNAILPRNGLARTKIPDATPGIIERYALSDEQALLAKIRYNRLLDIFTGVACYSLQNHLRTSITVRNPIKDEDEKSQVETDEVYVGLDRHGAHYAIPVQAKGGTDALSVVQIWQDFHVVAEKYPALGSRPIASQFMTDGAIALFEFQLTGDYDITITQERHYELVPHEQLDDDDLKRYLALAEKLP